MAMQSYVPPEADAASATIVSVKLPGDFDTLLMTGIPEEDSMEQVSV
jgi:hypothetical protein